MNKYYVIAFFVSAFLFGACSSSDSPGYDSSLSPANATKPVTPLTIADTLLSDTATTAAAITTAAVTTPIKQVAVPSAKTTTVKSTVAGLNPAHGLPGHRCDIAVGAPLNSPAQQPVTAAPGKANITPMPSPATNAVGNSTARLNPPHGQPGHDCAVQVGAPLKN